MLRQSTESIYTLICKIVTNSKIKRKRLSHSNPQESSRRTACFFSRTFVTYHRSARSRDFSRAGGVEMLQQPVSRGCRFCDFFVAEWTLQHNHPLLPLSRAISLTNVFLKAPLEIWRNSLGNVFQRLAPNLEKEPWPWFWFSLEVWTGIFYGWWRCWRPVTSHNNGRHLGCHLGFYQELEIRFKPREMVIFWCLTWKITYK